MPPVTVKSVLQGIALIPAACIVALFLLLICMFHNTGPWHQTNEHRENHHTSCPISLKLRLNNSTLILPFSPTPHLQRGKHKIPSWNGSLLMVKLLLEPRKYIWERCIGGRILHLTTAHYRSKRHSRLVHIVCHGNTHHESYFFQWLPFDGVFDDNGTMIAACLWQDSKLLFLALTYY